MFNLEEYTTVRERINMFWEKYPDGSIQTEILEWGNSRFIVKASLYRLWTDEKPFSTGHAKEEVSERGVNRDFALENGETSAIGVAMKNAGIGTDKHGPSREEMMKVQSKVKASEEIVKAKEAMANTAKEYVPVPKEDDPWTIRDAAPITTITDAVDTVKAIIGTQSEVPKCPTCSHDMVWSTGTAKTGRSWGKFACNRAVGSGLCKQVIWYEVKPNGSWGPQEKRG